MILVDTGPLVALFDRHDRHHARCRDTLATLREPLLTTVPVLTEAFHMLSPDSPGARALRTFVAAGGPPGWFLGRTALSRAFELMDAYADHPMDLADASLVVAGEAVRTRKVFTLDRGDFSTYRLRFGRRQQAFEVVP